MAECSKCGVEFLDSLIKQVEMKWEVGTVSRECSFSTTYTLCPQCYKEFNAFMGVKRGENNET